MNRTVFVVDDEPVIAATLAAILNEAGFKATAFQHPNQAIEAPSKQTPGLLVSDVLMPGMTGIELAIRFQKGHPDCKVLLFSGQAATAALLDEARKEGHNFELLLKPIHPVDLLARLRVWSDI